MRDSALAPGTSTVQSSTQSCSNDAAVGLSRALMSPPALATSSTTQPSGAAGARAPREGTRICRLSGLTRRILIVPVPQTLYQWVKGSAGRSEAHGPNAQDIHCPANATVTVNDRAVNSGPSRRLTRDSQTGYLLGLLWRIFIVPVPQTLCHPKDILVIYRDPPVSANRLWLAVPPSDPGGRTRDIRYAIQASFGSLPCGGRAGMEN